MKIGEKVKKSTTEFVNRNLLNKDMIYRAYVYDYSRHRHGGTSRYFWYYAMPMLISLALVMMTITINNQFLNDNAWTFLLMIMANLYAAMKNYFGLSKVLLYGVIHMLTKVNKHSYYSLLFSYYVLQEVSPEIKEEILENYSKEDIIKLTLDGVITNFMAWELE